LIYFRYVECGCVNPFLWNTRTIILPGTNKTITAPVCSGSDIDPCYARAVENLLNSADLKEKYCSDCSQQCSIVDFAVQISSLLTPMEWQMGGIKQFVENSTIPLPSDWSTAWHTYIQTNYLAISVVRQSDIVENYTQSPKILEVDIISSIGGQTGLWIGMSFLSLMELIEMLYRVIRATLRRNN
jgi:hypothetical protein